MLVQEYGASMEIRDIAGETPIHDTLRKSNWQNLKALIDLGCDVNSVGSRGYSRMFKRLVTAILINAFRSSSQGTSYFRNLQTFAC
jgi:ankyrin repeat protein